MNVHVSPNLWGDSLVPIVISETLRLMKHKLTLSICQRPVRSCQ